MKVLETISEDQFIAIFLKEEVNSERFGDRIKKQLNQDGKPLNIVTEPDTSALVDNKYRKNLLGITRGYGVNKALFENFPQNVPWNRVKLDKNDLSEAPPWQDHGASSFAPQVLRDYIPVARPQGIVSRSKAKYINYDQWLELTKGSRYPRDARDTIKSNIEIFG